ARIRPSRQALSVLHHQQLHHELWIRCHIRYCSLQIPPEIDASPSLCIKFRMIYDAPSVIFDQNSGLIMSDQFALSSGLISELRTGMRLRGVQYRRIPTGPSFGISSNARPGQAYFHYLAMGSALLRTEDGVMHELSAG